ncbi:MAG: hypothetical protein R3F60_06945 [bacterium]
MIPVLLWLLAMPPIDPAWRCADGTAAEHPPPRACVSADGQRIYFPKETWAYDKAELRPRATPSSTTSPRCSRPPRPSPASRSATTRAPRARPTA